MPSLQPTVDFRTIRPKPPGGTQADGFEELYSQLLRSGGLVRWPEGTRFERFGNPDGGREGRAILPNGDVWCWQAKFQFQFDSSEDINESFSRATDSEPSMTRYLVGMPMDLPAGARARGKSAHTKWVEWVDAKKEEFAAAGRTIEFDFHGFSELHAALLEPGNAGSLRYWFDRAVLTSDDLKRRYETSRSIAGPRYVKELTVEVPLADVLNSFRHGPSATEPMRQLLGRLDGQTTSVWRKEAELSPIKELKQTAFDAIAVLRDSVGAALDAIERGEIPTSFTAQLDVATAATTNLNRAVLAQDPDPASGRRHLDRDSDNLSDAVTDLERECHTPRWSAFQNKALLITGPSGVGKTHHLVDLVRQCLDEETPAILLMAEEFTSGPIEHEVARLIGFGTLPTQLLETLDVAARSAGKTALIVIDGLNETSDRTIWRTYLESFLTQARQFENVRIVLSCRTEFLESTVSDGARRLMLDIRHDGFGDAVEDAIQQFAEFYDLDQPTFPQLVPEFMNPLFLTLACKAAQHSGTRAFPRASNGLSWLVSLFLDSVNSTLSSPSRCDFREKERPVHELCAWFAEQLSGGARALPLREVEAQGEKILPRGSWEKSLVHALIRESVLTTLVVSGEEAVRFAYERIGDVLIAADIASKRPEERNDICVRLATKWWASAGILDALAIVLPERVGVELCDVLPAVGDYDEAMPSFIRSLQWRSPSSITARTLQIFTYLLGDDEYMWPAFDAFVSLGPLPNHPLNADALHTHLSKMSLSERDQSWTRNVNFDAEEAGLVGRLSDWAWSPTSQRADSEVARLCAITLGWTFTCTRRSTRDNATKALVAIFESHPEVAAPVLQGFSGCDDPYVIERLFAGCFGAAARRNDAEGRGTIAAAVAAITTDIGWWPDHMLSRHYARRVIELGAAKGWKTADEALLKSVRPPYGSVLPSRRLTDDQIKQMVSGPDYAYASVGHSVLSDFGDFRKYVMDHPVSLIQTPETITAQLFAELLFERVVLDLGWTPERFGKVDTEGSSRGDREDRRERIGKKYQWIAFWELLATLTDNFEVKAQFDDHVRPYEEPLDVDAPDIDPTMLTPAADQTRKTGQAWFDARVKPIPDGIRSNWLETEDFVPDPADLILVTDSSDVDWIVLEGHYSVEQTQHSDSYRDRNDTHFMWLQARTYLVDRAGLDALAEWAAGKDWYGRWMPESGDPYGLYLAEHPRGQNWARLDDDDDYFRGGGSQPPVRLEVTATSYNSTGGSWDSSHNRQVTAVIPTSHVCEYFGASRESDFVWTGRGPHRALANFGVAGSDGTNALFANADELSDVLERRNQALFLTVLAEKGTHSDVFGERETGKPFARSYSASYVYDGGRLRLVDSLIRVLRIGTGEADDPVGWPVDRLE